jgi:hypothetical protein
MKLRVAFCALTVLVAPVVLAKTKMLVEDPDNVVVGRYAITESQRAAAKEAAETFLASGKTAEIQKAYAIRYLGVDVAGLTSGQSSKEPASIVAAEKRFSRFGVEFDPNLPTHPIAIYDTMYHRVIHGRLYTVTWVPEKYYYLRMDDYVVMYIGSWVNEGKEALQK